MNACPTFPATPIGIAFRLIYRIVAFLALCIRACGLEITPATMSHSCALPACLQPSKIPTVWR